jgi:glycosyltransferase involved in cell wall biosynthesis
MLVASGIVPPDPGGPSTHLAQLIPGLLAGGHTVRAVAFGGARPRRDPCEIALIPLDASLPARAFAFARAYRRLARWADVVYVATLGLPRPPQANPVVLRVPGDHAWERAVNRRLVPPTQDIEAFQQARVPLRVAWLRWARAREARRAERVLVPSAYLRRLVLGWGVDPARIGVVPSAVADDDALGISREEARRQLGWPPEERYLVTAARLTAWKGVDYLIDAVAGMAGVTLVVAGDGPEQAALAARAASRRARVRFVGALSRASLAVHLRAADYFVLYSGYEGLPHVVLEALRAGTPVIASNRGGNPEIVRDGHNGLLVPHPNPDALAAAIRRALHGELRESLAARAAASLEPFRASALIPVVMHEIAAAADGRHPVR